MSDYKIILLFIIIVFAYSHGNFNRKIRDKVKELKRRSIKTYGEPIGYLRQWDTGRALFEYPHENQQKALIASLWSSYYDCCAKQLDSLTKHDSLPSLAAVVYEGAVARLPCECVSPEERGSWLYSKSLNNLSFAPLEDKDSVVEERDALLIYNAGREDAGVYSCQIGSSVSGLAVLEIIDDEYDVIKPRTSRGPYASTPRTLADQGLTVFSSWAPWSECSTCGAVGRRRRYGMCYVKTAENKADNVTNKDHEVLTEGKKIFDDFPYGLSCRSEYLPESMRSLPEVRQRRNEIMMGLCKVPCKRAPKPDFDVFLSRQPAVARDIVFAKLGQTVKLRCPGSTFRDRPVSWRVRGLRAAARALAVGSGGRARIDARDRLVLSPAVRADSDVYSCGTDEKIVGYVTLIVK